MGDIPEQVYLDAARACDTRMHGRQPGPDREMAIATNATSPMLRAVVESAYRSGYGQGRNDEAAGLPTGPDDDVPDRHG